MNLYTMPHQFELSFNKPCWIQEDTLSPYTSIISSYLLSTTCETTIKDEKIIDSNSGTDTALQITKCGTEGHSAYSVGNIIYNDGIVVYTCPVCSKVFSRKSWMVKHQKTHRDTKHFSQGRYKCEKCGRGCPTPSKLKKHMASHIKPHKCKLCGKGFSLEESMKKHELKHVTRVEATEHTCVHCGKCFPSLDKLNRHIMCHTKPFKCEVCKRGFSQRVNSIKCKHRPTKVKEICKDCGRTVVDSGKCNCYQSAVAALRRSKNVKTED